MFTKRDDKAYLKARRRQGVETRSNKKKNFIVRKPITEKFKRSVSYLGPKAWNALPLLAQTAPNINVFKSKINVLVNKKKNKRVA